MLKWLRGNIVLILLLILAGVLRFYKIDQNIVFHAELGDNYLAIKNFLLSGNVPLVGPETSHTWLSFGPLYYYFMAPVFAVFDFSPKIGSYVFAVLGLILLIINFRLVAKIFDRRTAIISSFIISISPVFLYYDRESRFFSIVMLIFYPFYYYLIKNKFNARDLFLLGVFYGLFFSFHYSPIIFLPIIIFVLLIKKTKFKDYVMVFLGFLISNIPLIIHEFINSFEMTKNILMWIPYRILGFSGLYPKNTLTIDLFYKNINSIFKFFNSIYTIESMFYCLGAAIFAFFIFVIRKNKKPHSVKILIGFLIFGLLSLFIHGDPPAHYFLPLIPVYLVLVSWCVGKLFDKHPKIIILMFIIFTYFEIKYLFSDRWFYKFQNTNFRSLTTQEEIAKKIVKDANGKPFSLGRIGEGDNFKYNFAQNYIYLMWYFGNQPKVESNLKYVIDERGHKNENLLFKQGNIFINKYEN